MKNKINLTLHAPGAGSLKLAPVSLRTSYPFAPRTSSQKCFSVIPTVTVVCVCICILKDKNKQTKKSSFWKKLCNKDNSSSDKISIPQQILSFIITCLLLFSLHMLPPMEWDPADGGLDLLADEPPLALQSLQSKPRTSNISENEFSCHCCYDILVNPTTLTCGHNFCRHCLALWWESSRKNECPECRQMWEGFPKINIMLRDAIEKIFREVVHRRRAEIKKNPQVSRSLLAFQRYGDKLGRPRTRQYKGAGFFSGVLTALTCVAVMVLVYHWGSGVLEQHDLLISKPVSHWTPEEVISWLEQLGPWTENYRKLFQVENVNGRLLLMLEDEDLVKPPFNIEKQTHRRAVLAELERVKALGVKPPQNLWEYKAANAGKSLFLLYGLKHSPRLTIFYLYLFDYSETFLPFLHTCCPAITHINNTVESRFLHTQVEPSWQQWGEFLVKYFLLPYQLIAEFAWDWLAVHYWTSRFIIVNAMLLTMLEAFSLWRLWTTAPVRTLPQKTWIHLCKMLYLGFAFALVWSFIPQFVCNCFFYWALYFSPIINIDLVVQQLMHPETWAR